MQTKEHVVARASPIDGVVPNGLPNKRIERKYPDARRLLLRGSVIFASLLHGFCFSISTDKESFAKIHYNNAYVAAAEEEMMIRV